LVGVGEELSERRGARGGGRLGTAGANGLSNGCQRARGRGVVEALVQDLPVEAVGFLARAGAGNEINPRSGAVGRKRFVAEELAKDFAGAGRFDGAKGEFELLVPAGGLPVAGLDGGEPRGDEIVDGEPEGVVEVFVGGIRSDCL